MSYSLKIECQGAIDQMLDPSVRLFPVSDGVPGSPIEATLVRPGTYLFESLDADDYLLSYRYGLGEKHFDSFYFQLDIPDITLIRLELSPKGSQIDQMGFRDQGGEFVDMLIYEDEKPWLARAVEDFPFLQTLVEFLVFRFQHLPPAEARIHLSQLLGDLDQVFRELDHLWPYQLKMLLQPAYMAQTTAEWKASLLHLLRNNLILIDDETLYEHLQDATQQAQQEEAVARLSEQLEWDPVAQSWTHLDAFLQALKGKRMALT